MEIKPGYKQTEVGVIPEDWEVPLLDTVAKRGSGHTPNKNHPEYWNGDIKWISLKDSDCLDNVYINDTAAKITPEGIKNSSATLHPAGTVVLSRDAGVGKSAIMQDSMAVSQHFMAWICSPQLDNHFLYYWLQAEKPEFERIAIGSTIKTIGLPYFKKLKIPLPPPPEQRAITQSLSDVDALIAALDQLITKKRNIKQGTMQQLLTGKRRLPGFSCKWEVEKLENISSEIGDGIHATPKYVSFSDFYFINGNNLINNSIQISEKTKCVSEEEYHKYKNSLSDKTILMSINGTIGNIAFFNNEHVILGKSAAYINIKTFISKHYLFYFLQTHAINCYFEDELTGSTIRNLSLKSIRNAPILIPPTIEEQKAIAQVLSDMDAEIEALEQKRDKYKAVKQGMMQELLTGKTRLIDQP